MVNQEQLMKKVREASLMTQVLNNQKNMLKWAEMFWPKLSSDTINSSKIPLIGTMVEEKQKGGQGMRTCATKLHLLHLTWPFHLWTHGCHVCLHKTYIKKISPISLSWRPRAFLREYWILILPQEMGVIFFICVGNKYKSVSHTILFYKKLCDDMLHEDTWTM